MSEEESNEIPVGIPVPVAVPVSEDTAMALRNTGDYVFSTLSDQSPGVQVAVGAVPGVVTGYVFKRVSSSAAAALGGGLILVQLASRYGYISINWRRLERDTKRQWEQVRDKSARVATGTAIGGRSLQSWSSEAASFVKDHAFVSGGFISGFLLGLASG